MFATALTSIFLKQLAYRIVSFTTGYSIKKEILIKSNNPEALPDGLRRRQPENRFLPMILLLIIWFSWAVAAVHANFEEAKIGADGSSTLADLLSPQVLDQSLLPVDFKKITQEDQERLTSAILSATQISQDNIQPSEDQHRWSSFLPIWGEEAREKGYELPLPFGVAGSFFYGYRDIDVDSVDVDIRNISLAVDRLAHIDVKSEERNWSMRFDAWMFPFLNLYLLAGYTEQSSDVGVDLNLRTAPLLRFILPRHSSTNLDLNGTTFGGGTTLVGGYKQFYIAADTNYTFSNLKGDLTSSSTFDQTVDALLFSTRVGWRTNISTTKVNFWLGGTYWGIAQTVNGDVQIPVLGNIDFEVEESPAHALSAHLGTHIEFTECFNFTFDVGANFVDMFSMVPALSYRF